MTGNSAFIPVREEGWRRGLGNLMRAGFASWWQTSTWWVHALIWTGVINMVLFGMLQTPEVPSQDAVGIYSLFAGMFPTVAVIIIMQGAIVGEKQSGTAAWVLSKPVSREAYVLSKLVPNAVGMVATMILLPGLLALVQMLASDAGVTVARFFLSLAVITLHLLFYLALTVMLGAFFDQWGAVIAIPLGLLFGQQYLLSMIPALRYVLPWSLVMPLGDDVASSLAGALMLGVAPEITSPLYVILLATVACVVVAIWRFRQEEF